MYRVLQKTKRQGINIPTLKFQLSRKEHTDNRVVCELEHNRYRVSLEIPTCWHYLCLGTSLATVTVAVELNTAQQQYSPFPDQFAIPAFRPPRFLVNVNQ
jgi:hypothetical protein